MFGPLTVLVSENGPQFISLESETLLKTNGVNHIQSQIVTNLLVI